MEIELGETPSSELIGVRDALHVPVICVIAHTTLRPGEPVGIRGDKTEDDNHIGVVDPFCKGAFTDEPVNVILKPKTTGHVRHVWEHPQIDAAEWTEPDEDGYRWATPANPILHVQETIQKAVGTEPYSEKELREGQGKIQHEVNRRFAEGSDPDKDGISPDHARRIVACVNACEGIPDALLEENGPAWNFRKRAEKAEAERDRLRDALRIMEEPKTVYNCAETKAAWDAFLKKTAETLDVTAMVLEEAIDNLIDSGTTVGGLQVDTDLDAVDWKQFWQFYNRTHGTSYSFSEDPFCC